MNEFDEYVENNNKFNLFLKRMTALPVDNPERKQKLKEYLEHDYGTGEDYLEYLEEKKKLHFSVSYRKKEFYDKHFNFDVDIEYIAFVYEFTIQTVKSLIEKQLKENE